MGSVFSARRLRSAWQEVRWPCLTFVASRLTIILVMLTSRQIMARGPFVQISGQMEHGGTLLDLLTQWDGVWYRMVAQHGYGSPSVPLAPAFFPFYPVLIRIVAFFIRDYQVASLVVSNCCLLVAAVVFDRLLWLDYKETTRRRALMFLMFNPVSFFFPAPTPSQPSSCSRSAPFWRRGSVDGF
ncbi:MAG: hypothetical protein H0U99_00650 [Chthoniobacterales bacterium]|nr:hypothetical protein [Chthoniobacterales bacterium]